MYVSTATCASGHRSATAASMRLGPHASTTSASGAVATAVPRTPRDPSSVAHTTLSPSASPQSSAAVRAPWTHVTRAPAARASLAASAMGATPSPPLTSTTPAACASSNPRPNGPRQLTRSPISIASSAAVPVPTAFRTISMSSSSARYTEKGRRKSGPGAQPRLTNCPARTVEATCGARIVSTSIPRATSRRPVIGASNRNTVAPLADRPDLHLLARIDRRFEQRGCGVERGKAGNAPLHRGAPDLESVLDHRIAVARVLVDVRHRVDDELHLAADDDVDHVGRFLADLAHDPWRKAGCPQGSRGAFRRDQLAAKLNQTRHDREELRLVGVGDGQEGDASALDVHARRGKRLAQCLIEGACDADGLPRRLHLRAEVRIDLRELVHREHRSLDSDEVAPGHKAGLPAK